MSSSDPAPTIGDQKDWTWSTREPCPDCGFDPGAIRDDELPGALRSTTARWEEVLRRSDVGDRPEPRVWSPLEYACHVRDAHEVFTARVALMLAEDGPQFADWDQDRVARDGRYWAQDPDAVARELAANAERTAAGYDAVPADGWSRTGRRGDGAEFTVGSLGHYHLHDVTHHLWDVRGAGDGELPAGG